MIFAAIDFAVGQFAFDIIQSEYGVIFAYALELPAHTNQLDSILDLTLDVAVWINLGNRSIG